MKLNYFFLIFIIVNFIYTLAWGSDGNRLNDSICGKINVIGPVDTDGINAFLDGILDMQAVIDNGQRKLGKNIVSCNIPGDEFQVCRACQDAISLEQMSAILPMLSNTTHRFWHDSWHRIWKLAGEVDLDPPFETLTQAMLDEDNIESLPLLKERGWLPEKNQSTFLKQIRSYSYESFLYMHRQMIKMVNIELTAKGLPCIKPWKEIPLPSDSLWPTPRILQNPNDKKLINSLKQQNEQMQEIFKRLSNTNHLTEISLNDLGREIVFDSELHLMLHEFFADSEPIQKAKCLSEESTSKTCDTLTSNISSPLNKHFWKLHGLIDDLIGKWLSAHKYKIIAEDCTGKDQCYEWQGTYLGLTP